MEKTLTTLNNNTKAFTRTFFSKNTKDSQKNKNNLQATATNNVLLSTKFEPIHPQPESNFKRKQGFKEW